MIDSKYEIHFAPLQGLTDASFRRLHSRLYGGVDYYYTPFFRIERGLFRKRDLRDLAEDTLPNTVPQVLPGSAEELKRLCEPALKKGIRRVDINIGCPFPPVMAHGRGAALLNNPDRLEGVLRGVEEMSGDVEFSLKMRLGYDSTEQWKDVVDMINGVKLRHVTMHARYARQQYGGECSLEAFGEFAGRCAHPVVYNGDLRTAGDVEALLARCPGVRGVMIGRGLLADPNLALRLRGKEAREDRSVLRELHDGLVADAEARMTESRQVAEHMKPYWEYFCDEPERLRRELKAIKKSSTADKYVAAAAALFANW